MFSFFKSDSSLLLEVWLVAYEQNTDIVLCMFSQFREPTLNVLEGAVLGDVVDKEGTNCIAIVSVSDSSVAFLTCSVPYLCSHILIFNFDTSGCEFDSNSRLRIDLELVLCVSKKEIRFSHPWVTNQHYFEEVIVVVLVIAN